MDQLVRRHRRLFAYDDWANREVAAGFAARPLSSSSPRALRLLNHVIGAERLWLARLEKTPPLCAVWPEWTLAEMQKQLRQLPRAWEDWFADVADADLDEPIAYVNSKGQPFTSSVDDILTHVILHSTHHRAQIAAEVRSAGQEPAATDFIHCVRNSLI